MLVRSLIAVRKDEILNVDFDRTIQEELYFFSLSVLAFKKSSYVFY